jgi:hypothetical protein
MSSLDPKITNVLPAWWTNPEILDGLPHKAESTVDQPRPINPESLSTNTKGAAAEPLPELPDKIPSTDQEKLDWDMIALRKKAAKLPVIEDVSEFIMKPIVKSKVLVEGMLHQGSKLGIGGGSKSFKTWMMLDLALSVTHGVSWLGLNTMKARVLYCNFEIQEEFMQDRIKAIEKAKNLTTTKGLFDLWNLRGYAAPYDVIIPLIMERIKNIEYGMIAIDPIYKIYGETDENSAGDVAALMNALESLAVKSKAAVVFGAHYSKGNQSGKDSIDRMSGSGVFGRDPDSHITVSGLDQQDGFVVEANLRNFKPLESFGVKWQYPLMERDCSLNIKKLKTNISKQAVYTVDELLVCLSIASKTKKELKDAAMASAGMKESTFNKLFKEMESTEGIHLDAATKRYSYAHPHRASLS